MSRSTLITIAVILLIVGAVGWYTLSLNTPEARLSKNEAGKSLLSEEGAAPYTDLAGNPVDLSNYAGNVLVVNSWASWCPFCVDELPDFDQLAEEFSAEGVVVLAINRKESRETAERFLNSLGGEVDDVVFVLDPDDRFYRSVGGFTMPETVFYDREGNVVVHKRGFMTLEEMRQHVEAARNSSGS